MPLVHLKDFVCKNFGAGPVYQLIDSNGNVPDKKRSRADNGFEYRALGRGIQDIKTILETCEECGTDIVIVEQDESSEGFDELESAKLSRDYLKNTFGI